MITKNINGIVYWKIQSFSVVHNKIEISLQGYLNENDNQHLKLFSIDCPTSVIQNITDYGQLVVTLENYITTNIPEFQNNE